MRLHHLVLISRAAVDLGCFDCNMVAVHAVLQAAGRPQGPG